MSGAAAKQPPGAGSATDPAAAGKAAVGDAVPEPPPPLLSVDVTGLVSQFARSFVLIFPVYVLGYLGLSFSWVLIALCGLFWIRRHRGGKTSRLGRALAFLEDEEEAVRLSVSSADLPAWVSGQHPSVLPREHPRPAGSAAAGRAGARHLPGDPRGGPLLPGLRGTRFAAGRSRPGGREGERGVRRWHLPRPWAARPSLPAPFGTRRPAAGAALPDAGRRRDPSSAGGVCPRRRHLVR